MEIKQNPNHKINMNKAISKKTKLGIVSGVLAFSLFTSATVTLLGIGNIISTHQSNDIQQKNNVLQTENSGGDIVVDNTNNNKNTRQFANDLTPDDPIPDGQIMNPVTDFSPVKTPIEKFPNRNVNIQGYLPSKLTTGSKLYAWNLAHYPKDYLIGKYAIEIDYSKYKGLSLDYLMNAPKTWLSNAEINIDLNPADYAGKKYPFAYVVKNGEPTILLPTLEIPLRNFVENQDRFEIDFKASITTPPSYHLAFTLDININVFPKQQKIIISNSIINTTAHTNTTFNDIRFYPLGYHSTSLYGDLYPTITIKAPNFLQTYERFARIIMERGFKKMTLLTPNITELLLGAFSLNYLGVVKYNDEWLFKHQIFNNEIESALKAFNNPQTQEQQTERAFWINQNIDLSGVMQTTRGKKWELQNTDSQNPKGISMGFKFVLGIPNSVYDEDFWTDEFKSIDINLHGFLKQKVGPILSDRISTTFPNFDSYFSTQNSTILNSSEYTKKQWLISQFKKLVETDFFRSGNWTNLPSFDWLNPTATNGRYLLGVLLHSSFEKHTQDDSFVNIDYWKTKPEIIFNIPIEYSSPHYFPQNSLTTIPFSFTSNIFVKQDPLPIPNLKGVDSPIVSFNIDVRDKIFNSGTDLQLRFEDIFKPENYSKFFLDTPYDITRLKLVMDKTNKVWIFQYLQNPNSQIFREIVKIGVDNFRETIQNYTTPDYDLGSTTKSAEYIQSAINGFNMETLKSDVFNEYFKNVPGFEQNKITEFNLTKINDTQLALDFKLNYVYEPMAIQMRDSLPNSHPVVFKIYNSIKVKPDDSQKFKLIINVQTVDKKDPNYLKPTYDPWKEESTSIIEKFTQTDVLTLAKQDLSSIEIMKNTVILKEEKGVIDYKYDMSLNGTNLTITPVLTSYLDSWDLQTSQHFKLKSKTFNLSKTLLSKSKIILDDLELFNNTMKNISESDFYNLFPSKINIIDKQKLQDNPLFNTFYNFFQTETQTREKVLIITDEPNSPAVRDWITTEFNPNNYYILVSFDWRKNYKMLESTILNPNITTTINNLTFYEKSPTFKIDTTNSIQWELNTKNQNIIDDKTPLNQDNNSLPTIITIILGLTTMTSLIITLWIFTKNNHKRSKIISKKEAKTK